jgi:hypothetical protein
MRDLVISNRLRDMVWEERDRLARKAVRLVGKLCEDVMEEMAATTVDAQPVAEAKPLNGEAHVVEDAVEKAVERIISQKFGDVLSDISYRISVLQDLMKAAEGKPSRVTSAQLNLAHHLLDGYTFSANSPSPGYVAWSDCHIVYQGTDYTITNSNTSQKYIYWLQATPSSFQVSNTKLSLGANDCLVCVNESGTPNVVLMPGKFRSGASLLDGTVGANELGSGAVTSAKIAASAIFSSHISPGAVGTSQLADSAVTGPKIGAGAVATSKLNLATHMLY